MKPLEHPCEQRPIRHGEVIVWNAVPVRGLYVCMMQLVGPRGPWDYAVATYFEDGTRVLSSWQGPTRERAEEMLEGFVESWRDDDRTPNAAEVFERWHAKQRQAS